MLRRRLIWRLVAPTLLLSVLLLLMGGGAAWYVHQGDLRTAEALDKGIDAAFTSEELLLSIRDMRRHLDRYEATKDPAYIKTAVDGREQVNNYLRLVQSDPLNQTVAVKASLESMDRFKQQIFAELEQLPANPTTQQLNTLRNQISDHLVLPATQLLQNRRDFAKQGSFRNRVFVDHLRDGLVLLGICGALAGLIAGFAIARGFTRSLEQLGASAHEIMGTLGKFDHHSSTSASDVPARYGSAPQSLSENVDVLPDLQFTLKAVADRTALVVQELQNARKVSERSDQLAAIGQLAAGLAHELRNPLTSMKLLAQTALERQKGLAGHDLRILEEEISRLEHLLQTFLDFARPARLKIERLDLGVLVEQTVEFARRRAIQHQIVLAYECPEREILLEADATQIRQVVLNLLLNAIDAQQEGGTIRIGVSEEAGPRRLGMIVVADEGSGLPDGYGETIFDPFVSTKETGVGLGLSICKRIVESHGGYMTAANRAPQGAEFHVYLPLVNTDTENASPREIPSVSRP